jgi:hypothetical protein
MKTTKFTCLALLILTLPVARGEPSRTDINPALLYYRSFLLVPDPMSNADEEYLWSRAGREQKLPERYGKIFAGYDNQFSLVRQAAHATVPCDWGLDLSVGPNAMLPYLARVKAVVQAAQLRVMWNLQHGNQTSARDDLLAAFVLARNASRDGTLIGVLVQDACEVLLFATVAQNFGQFAPETLQQLVNGFDAAPPPRTLAAIIAGEKSNIHDWLVDRIRKIQQENQGNDAKVMEAIRPDFELLDAGSHAVFGGNQDTNLWQRMVIASGGTSDGILKLLGEADPLYLRLGEIMALPEREYADRIKEFNAEIQKSPNPLLPLLFQFSPLRVREFRTQALTAMVHAAMEFKLHGEAGLKSVMDPFGDGPFACQRFVFKGVDRGFELKSAYAGLGFPCAMIFVEKGGPAFYIEGPHEGQPKSN